MQLDLEWLSRPAPRLILGRAGLVVRLMGDSAGRCADEHEFRSWFVLAGPLGCSVRNQAGDGAVGLGVLLASSGVPLPHADKGYDYLRCRRTLFVGSTPWPRALDSLEGFASCRSARRPGVDPAAVGQAEVVGGEAGRSGEHVLRAEPGLGEEVQFAVQAGAVGGHERGGVGPGEQGHACVPQGLHRADGVANPASDPFVSWGLPERRRTCKPRAEVC